MQGIVQINQLVDEKAKIQIDPRDAIPSYLLAISTGCDSLPEILTQKMTA